MAIIMKLRSTIAAVAAGGLLFALAPASAARADGPYSKNVACVSQHVVEGKVGGTFMLDVKAAGAVNSGYGYPSPITIYATSTAGSGKVTVSSTGSINLWNGYCVHA
ncbi:MAG: hypothetical protein QM582_10525 [Micropruina sp.]|uniref:hypothetical protein n=1 Tax=Micropruina sp. TaxID=2737536 RepID=UPI0039E40823